jgi:hypothetical protein
MIRLRNIILISALLLLANTPIHSQTALDSIIRQRNSIYAEFKLLDEKPGEKTWIKMANLHSRTKELIEIDNTLINYYLFKEIESNTILSDKIDRLALEIALVKKEAEFQDRSLDEKKYFINGLLVVIGVLSLLFFGAVILFIDRQIRYRSLKLELERSWPMKEDLNRDSNLPSDILRLNKQVGELTLKNSALLSELEDQKQKNRENEENLAREILAKKQIEEEIKKLIIQIKSQ